jgi:dehydrogenase/reductase SDR family protein 7B
MTYEGKVVWITGASSGIGAALAVELASKGARLVLSARRNEQLKEVLARCEREHDHLLLPLDVTDDQAISSAFETVLGRFGHLDVLVANAGIGQRSSVLESDLETERTIMDVNFFGCTALAKCVLPHFLERNEGQIVVISSIMGFIGTPRRATYAASKHALQGYFDGLRAELFRTNISVSTICPGYIHTDISRSALLGTGTTFGEMDDQHRHAMPAHVFARKAVRGMEKGKPIMFIGGPERFAPLLARLSPALVRYLLPRIIKRK